MGFQCSVNSSPKLPPHVLVILLTVFPSSQSSNPSTMIFFAPKALATRQQWLVILSSLTVLCPYRNTKTSPFIKITSCDLFLMFYCIHWIISTDDSYARYPLC